MGDRATDAVALTLLIVSSVLLALLELFFLPLRLDGRLLPAAGAVPFPLSVLAALVTTPWLVARAGRLATGLGGGAGYGAVPLAGWLVTIVVVGLFGPGGDTVLVADWRGLALLLAGLLPASLVLGSQLGRQRRAATSGG